MILTNQKQLEQVIWNKGYQAGLDQVNGEQDAICPVELDNSIEQYNIWLDGVETAIADCEGS